MIYSIYYIYIVYNSQTHGRPRAGAEKFREAPSARGREWELKDRKERQARKERKGRKERKERKGRKERKERKERKRRNPRNGPLALIPLRLSKFFH